MSNALNVIESDYFNRINFFAILEEEQFYSSIEAVPINLQNIYRVGDHTTIPFRVGGVTYHIDSGDMLMRWLETVPVKFQSSPVVQEVKFAVQRRGRGYSIQSENIRDLTDQFKKDFDYAINTTNRSVKEILRGFDEAISFIEVNRDRFFTCLVGANQPYCEEMLYSAIFSWFFNERTRLRESDLRFFAERIAPRLRTRTVATSNLYMSVIMRKEKTRENINFVYQMLRSYSDLVGSPLHDSAKDGLSTPTATAIEEYATERVLVAIHELTAGLRVAQAVLASAKEARRASVEYAQRLLGRRGALLYARDHCGTILKLLSVIFGDLTPSNVIVYSLREILAMSLQQINEIGEIFEIINKEEVFDLDINAAIRHLQLIISIVVGLGDYAASREPSRIDFPLDLSDSTRRYLRTLHERGHLDSVRGKFISLV
jgi:hypothetical protein